MSIAKELTAVFPLFAHLSKSRISVSLRVFMVAVLMLSTSAGITLAAPTVPTYTATFADDTTGNNSFISPSDGIKYWYVDAQPGDANAGADNYYSNTYERPTIQTFVNKLHPTLGTVWASKEYFPHLDLVGGQTGKDNTYIYMSLDLYGTNLSGKLSEEYTVEIDYDGDIRGDFLFTADNPGANNATGSYTQNAVFGFKDVNNDVGGTNPLLSQSNGDLISPGAMNGYELSFFSDANPYFWCRIKPGDPSVVEFAINYVALGTHLGITLNPDSTFLKCGGADKGIQDPQKYWFHDKYTVSEAGMPYNSGYLIGNIYEYDNSCLLSVSGTVPNTPPVITVGGDTTLFLCETTEICIQLEGGDDDDDMMRLNKISGAGVFTEVTFTGSFDTTHCFIPDTSGTYCFVFGVDDDAFRRGVMEDDDDEDSVCITVIYNSPPSASCPPNSTKNVCNLSPICIPGFTATDPNNNIATKVVTGGTLTGSTVCFTPVVGNNLIRFIVTDSCGKADTCETTVNVILNSAPDAMCPGNSNMFVCNLNQICIPGFTATDPNNNIATKVVNNGTLTGSTVCFTPVVGNNLIRFIVTDSCGKADTCQTTVNVTLNSPPDAMCPGNSSMFVCNLNQICIPGFTATDPDNNIATKVVNNGTLTGSTVCFTPVAGNNRIIFTVTDSCGSADACTTDVSVSLNSPPVANCPGDTSMFVCNLNQICIPGFTATDPDNNIATKVVSNGTLTGSTVCFTPVVGNNLIRFIVTDSCGKADTCQTTVNVTLNSPPVANCHADTSLCACNLNQICIPDFTATDPNNNIATKTVNVGTLSGSTVCFTPVAGNNLIRFIVTDSCGKADTCETIVTVNVDNTKPAFTNCPTNVTIQCNVAVPAPASPTATDNCDSFVTVTYLGETNTPGTCPQSYTLTRKWRAVDDCGNADTCTQVITVQDTMKPTFTNCPSNTTVQCNAVPAPASPTATDNCDSFVTVTYLGETNTPGTCPQSYTLTRKWRAVDDCGNADTCTQVITVQDTMKPTFTNCPPNANAQCSALPPVVNPTASDNCDSTVTVTYLGETINPGNCPYTITRKWRAVDDCGNADTCVQTLTVMDNIKPTFTNCPANVTVQCSNIPMPTNPSATDNCDTSVTVTYLGQTTTPGACPQSYTLTRKWEAKDDCNNTDTCTQVITVQDTTKPTFTNCPANATVQCNAVPVPTNPSANDNCDSTVTVTYLGDTKTPGSCPQSYTLTRKWRAVDDCGNADTCTQVITVQDTTKPTFTDCPANANAQCNALPPVVNPTATDNCDTLVTVTYLGATTTPGSCPSQYTLTRKWRAVDDCDNADTCTQVITVSDTTTLSLGADSTKNFGARCLPLSGTFKLRNATNCSPLTWKVNNVTASQDTTISYSAGYCTNFNQTWTISASDACGRSDSYTVTISANVNCPPVAACPSLIPDKLVCSLGVPVCIIGDGFSCSDGNGGVTTTLNGQPYNAGDPICFTPSAFGPYTLTLICSDGCGADTCVSTVNIVQGLCPVGCPVITIEKTHNTIQGQYETVAITLDTMPNGIGGFDLLIQYDASALGLSLVEPGSFITGCGWEYFTYRMGGCTNCGSSACPSGSVRIIAIAEINNGPNHPLCFQMEPAQLAVLTFLVTNDRTFECQYVPIRFMWCDCGDNTFSSIDGDSLLISEHVYDFFDNNVFTEITDLSAPFPGWFGANATCDVDPGNGKPAPIRCIDFYNGGIDIVCADSIDARGDINLNGLSNEVSDAVLLGNYFIYGINVFTVNIQGQIAASDVNADGTVLSVADLVYLIRVVVGDAQPFSKVAVPVDVRFTHSADGRLSVDNRVSIGAALVIAQGQVQPTLLADGMEVIHSFDGTNTRILVWSISGNSFTGDFLQVNGEITTVEMATAEGNPVTLNVVPTEFALHQNYPNPFNPKTVISFSLPTASDYKLAIFNVNGQEVVSFTGKAENAGTFEIEWEAGDYASGIYFYKLVAGPYSQIKKMILLK